MEGDTPTLITIGGPDPSLGGRRDGGASAFAPLVVPAAACGSTEQDTDGMNTTSAHSAGPNIGDREPRSVNAAGEILLVYDWECPACDAYCHWVRVRPSAGRLRLVNARESTAVTEEITEAGLDIDQGMVVKMGGQLYYGSDAIHALALVSSRSDLFNKLTHYVFRFKRLSHILYPGLRTCRNLLLKAMSKTKINNLRIEGNDRF